MPTVKEKIREGLDTQPEDASYDEIVRELIFERMLESGLADVRENRVISNDDMEHRIKTWLR